jgi:hypothetical protein
MENYLPKTMDFYLPKSMDFSLPFTFVQLDEYLAWLAYYLSLFFHSFQNIGC